MKLFLSYTYFLQEKTLFLMTKISFEALLLIFFLSLGYGDCDYSSPGSVSSYASPSLARQDQSLVWMKLILLLMFSYYWM
jgi:hypothetical protein